MRLADFVAVHLAGSPVFADSIWDKEAELVTGFQLTLFRARMSAQGLSRAADDAVELLQLQALRAMLDGYNGKLPFLQSPSPQPRFMADELADGLRRMPTPHAQAVLLALEEGKPLEWAVNLTWREVLHMTPRTSLCVEILRQRNSCRHIRLSYVFWHFLTGDIASPLMDLPRQVSSAFHVTWEELVLLYGQLVMVDRVGDAQDARALLSL